MKKNHFYKTLGFGLSLVAFSACTDLITDEKDSIVRENSQAGFTPGDPTELLASAYIDLGAYTDQNNIYALGQHTSAEMIPPTRGVDWGDNGIWRTLDAHTWDSGHPAMRDTWNQLNQRVFKTTEILASNPTPAQAAQAKFLRALNMYHVVDYFGQVPFRDVNQGVDEFPRILTRSEAFDFVVKDLEEALPGLPSAGPNPLNIVANKAAANFLLAKLHLNKAVFKGTNPAGPYTHDRADMDKVVAYVDAITAAGYKPEADFFNNFKTTAQNEIIFVSNEGTGQNRWYMTLHYDQNPSGWNGFTTLADFYDTFDKADPRIGEKAKGNGQEYSGIGYGFLIGQQINDRGQNMVDSRSRRPLAFTRDVPLAGAATDKGIRVIKYHPATAGKYVLMRFAEAVLMKAEAQLRSGNAAGALATTNTLRTTRGIATLPSLNENTLFDEIGRELYWEGGKRTVEVRFGKFLNGTGAQNNEPHTVLYPIPSQAIVSNPNLTQNPGY